MHCVNFYSLPPGYGRLVLSRRKGESVFVGEDLLIVESIKPDGVYLRVVDAKQRTHLERLAPGEWFRLGVSGVSIDGAKPNAAKVRIASPKHIQISRAELRGAA